MNNNNTTYKDSPLGKIPGDWEVRTLGELGNFAKGKGILKEQVISVGLPCIRYGEIYTTYDFIIKDFKSFIGEDVSKEVSIRNKADNQLTVLSCTKYDGLVPSLEYFGRKIFSDDISTYKVVPKNHFAYATNHIEEGSIGYQNTLKEALISPMYTVFKTDSSINDIYFYKLLKSHKLVYQYQNRMEGSIDRRGGLRWDAFSIIKVQIPSYEEQSAIALVLEIADKEIQLLKTKTEKLKEQKKGLMQVLLTGKKRLTIIL